jgi:hypothetical protein
VLVALTEDHDWHELDIALEQFVDELVLYDRASEQRQVVAVKRYTMFRQCRSGFALDDLRRASCFEGMARTCCVEHGFEAPIVGAMIRPYLPPAGAIDDDSAAKGASHVGFSCAADSVAKRSKNSDS